MNAPGGNHRLFIMSSLCITVLLSLVGTSLAAGLPYIIGGDEVSHIESWPWQGSLHQRYGGFVCGCSLISSDWAVTAASCVQSPPYDVRFGSLNRTEGTFRAVYEIIVHENYTVSGDYKYNDIAVLRFSSLELTNSTNTVRLGATDQAGNTESCHITGWGWTSYPASTYPESLHQAPVFVTYDTLCTYDWPNITSESHVCTFKRDVALVGTCQGDTGGPLVCFIDDHYELIGISSFEQPDCYAYYYSVFTQVSSFRQWIEDKTGIE